ncbi:MAG: CHAT domain-containing protein [Armatimonadetes bacterium]|nr:CHAT domain-containing protein [Armatimonadota bacterium]
MRWGTMLVGLVLVLPAPGGEQQDAERLFEEGAAAYEKGDLDGAETAWKAALAICERIAPDSGPVAACLGSLGNVAVDRGDLAAAEGLLKRALAIYERRQPDSLDVAQCLGGLGKLAAERGDLARAETYFRRTLAIHERLDPDSLLVANSHNNLGAVYYSRGDLAAAAALFGRSLAIRERLVPGSPEVADSLNNLGLVAADRGDLAEAEARHHRALAILERLAPDSPQVADNLNNLGTLTVARGDVASAEAIFKRVLALRQRVAPDSLDVADALCNLGSTAYSRGDLNAADAFYQQALAIRERLAPDSLTVAAALANLGLVALDRGDFAAADTHFKRALAALQRLAPDSLQVALCLNNMGEVARERGDMAAAAELNQRALAIQEKLAPDTLDVAASLTNLGLCASHRGEWAAAEAFQRRALDLRRHLAPDSLDVVASLNNLALDRAAADALDDALDCVSQAMDIEQKQLRRNFAVLSEREKGCFLELMCRGPHFLLSLAALRPEDPRFVRTACDWTLRRKGVLLSALLEERQALRLLGDEATAADWRALQAARAGLSHLLVAGPGAQPIEAYRARCDELAAQSEKLLKGLAEKSAAVRAQQVTDEADCEKVSRALPAVAALVELATYQPTRFKATENEPRTDPPRYVAFILRSGEPQPVMIDLGEAEPIDRAVGRLRARQGPMRSQPDDGRLYDLVWSRIETQLGGAKRIYFAPDGQLNLLACGALQDPSRKYLAERYTFVYLPSGRDLLRPATPSRAGQWVVVSNPKFGGEPGGAGSGQRAVIQGADRAALTGLSVTDLPGTKAEGGQVAALARGAGAAVQELSGAAATEAAVKAVARPAVVHLATHGLFLPDADFSSGPDGGRFVFVPYRGEPRRGATLSGNPMQRSMLLLAGAARSLKGEKTDGEDGILTAEEVVGMDLEGTRLVCLSACETGLGEVKQGEGVVGLRRAFQMAGAESLVMSLWRVPDAETRDLMIDFYRRFTAGESAPDAMTAAQRAILAERRAAKLSDAPFWWAGFVVGGR